LRRVHPLDREVVAGVAARLRIGPGAVLRQQHVGQQLLLDADPHLLLELLGARRRIADRGLHRVVQPVDQRRHLDRDLVGHLAAVLDRGLAGRDEAVLDLLDPCGDLLPDGPLVLVGEVRGALGGEVAAGAPQAVRQEQREPAVQARREGSVLAGAAAQGVV
jgi:hypothetical protein